MQYRTKCLFSNARTSRLFAFFSGLTMSGVQHAASTDATSRRSRPSMLSGSIRTSIMSIQHRSSVLAHKFTNYFSPLSAELFDDLNSSMRERSSIGSAFRLFVLVITATIPALILWSLPVAIDELIRQRGAVNPSTSQLVMLAFGRWLQGFSCTLIFPVWFRIFTGEYAYKSVYWLLPAADGVVAALLFLIPCAQKDYCIVPFETVVHSCLFATWAPFVMYFCLPSDKRRQLLRKSVLALALIFALVCFFGIMFPLAAVGIHMAESGLVKMAVSLGLIIMRFIFEEAAVYVAARVNPDGFPMAIFFGVCCYEIFVAIVVSETRAWYIFTAFILFDVLENAWHIYCVCTVGGASALRARFFLPAWASKPPVVSQPRPAWTSSEPPVVGAAQPGADTAQPGAGTAQPGAGATQVKSRLGARSMSLEDALQDVPAEIAQHTLEGRQFCLLAISVLMEVAEILSPACYMLLLVVVRNTNPKLYGSVAFLSDEEFQEMMLHLGLEVIVEIIVFICAAIAVQKYVGLKTLRLAGALLKVHGWPMFCVQVCVACYFSSLQYTLAGVDFQFGFHWMQPISDGPVDWFGGLCWVPRGETPNPHNCKFSSADNIVPL